MDKGKNNTGNVLQPLGKIAEFYVEQLEHVVPSLKNAADDWQSFCTWSFRKANEFQRNLVGKDEATQAALKQYQQFMQSMAESALNAQASWSKTSIDNTLELSRKLLDFLNQK